MISIKLGQYKLTLGKVPQDFDHVVETRVDDGVIRKFWYDSIVGLGLLNLFQYNDDRWWDGGWTNIGS